MTTIETAFGAFLGLGFFVAFIASVDRAKHAWRNARPANRSLAATEAGRPRAPVVPISRGATSPRPGAPATGARADRPQLELIRGSRPAV